MSSSRTRIRLQQISGSIADLAYSGSLSSATAATAGTVKQDLGGVLGQIVGAIGRISGKTGTGTDGFTNAAAGIFTHDTFSIQSANSTNPLLEIKNTTNDANGGRLRFVKDKGAAGAANDVAGLIEFFADDANQDQVKFSEIKSQVKVATNGQEGGKLTLSVAEHDGSSTAGLVIEDGDSDGELDVTIGAGAASVTTVAGNSTITGNITIGGNIVGDGDEAKAIFAASTTAGNSITIGGGADVVLGGDLKLGATGIIEDSGGHARLTATDDGVTAIGRADGTTAISVATNSVVTFSDDIKIKDGGTIGNASVADVMTLADSGIVTFKDDIKIKDDGTIGNATTPAAITIAAAGNVTLSNDLQVGGTSLLIGNTTVQGNLTVQGDVSYNYLTASVVEMKDPMIVLNAMSGSTGLATSSSFDHQGPTLENGTNGVAQDYGVVFKRSLAYSGSAGDGPFGRGEANPFTIHSQNTHNDGSNLDDHDAANAGTPFAIFKLDKTNPLQGADNLSVEDGQVRSFNLDTTNRTTVQPSMLLNELKGAYVLLSASHGKKLAMIRSGSVTGGKPEVELQILGANELYNSTEKNNAGEFAGNIALADFQDRKGSIHLLSAFGGTIFNKETASLEVAAAAITGSNDNNFISGSANILLYGAANVAQIGVYSNDLVSGSTEQGKISWDKDNGIELKATNELQQITLISQGASGEINFFNNNFKGAQIKQNTTGFAFHSGSNSRSTFEIQNEGVAIKNGLSNGQGALILHHNDSVFQTIKAGNGGGLTFTLPATITDGFFITTDGSGNLSFANPSAGTRKAVRIISESFPRLTALPIGAVDADNVTFGDAITGLSAGDVTQGRTLDVFVNGQLLMSGSATEVTNNQRDYEIENATSIKFAFQLEEDDVVQIIKR